jgi:hypothetical protein
MMLAFKRAATAAEREGDAAKIFSLGIAKVTGGEFSHVEAVLDRNDNGSYRCFSAREPDGTNFADIDLSDASLWAVVNLPTSPSQNERILAWCQGRRGRRYNFSGIEGILLGRAITDSHDDFCSQCCTELLQDNLGLWTGLPPYWVAPSGWRNDPRRRGLFELVSGTQSWPPK